jgi:hypothetical protein
MQKCLNFRKSLRLKTRLLRPIRPGRLRDSLSQIEATGTRSTPQYVLSTVLARHRDAVFTRHATFLVDLERSPEHGEL